MKNVYDLNLGLYKTRQDKIPLEPFNIKVNILGLSDKLKDHLISPKNMANIGKEVILQGCTYNSYNCLEGSQEVKIVADLYQLKFSMPECEDLDIDKFINAVKSADISREFYQFADTLTYGYLHLHINETGPIYKALRQLAKESPDSFLLPDIKKTKGETYYFPDSSDSHAIETFKDFMLNELKELPIYCQLIQEYSEDWNNWAVKQKSKANRTNKSPAISSEIKEEKKLKLK